MYKVKFDTGQIVSFQNAPTKTDIEEVSKKLGISKKVMPEQPTSFADKLVKTQTNETGLKGFATGFTKGILGTVTGLGQIASKGLSYLPGKAGEFFKGGAEYGADLQKGLLAPSTTSEKVGKTTEQIAEFFVPASKIQKAQVGIDIMTKGLKAPGIVKGATRVLGKAGVEGLGTGAVTFAQTGGDIKEAGKTALFAGGLKTVTGTGGELLKTMKFPEKLYSRIFKDTSDDVIAQIDNEMRAGLKLKDPAKYADYVSKGIIDPVTERINTTLAKQALDRGLKGSITNMAKQTVTNTWDLENTARNLVKGQPVKVSASGKLVNTLKEVAKDWKNVENGATAKEATKYVKLLQKGKIDGADALNLRRFLDGMRVKSSFNANVKLSQSQANFKYWADIVRGQLAKIPGVAEIMKNYSFNIEALMALGKEAAKINNRQVLGMIDSLFLGSGIAMGEPTTGLAVAGLRRLTQQAGLTTRAAQVIQKSGVTTKAGIATKGIIGSQF